MRTVLVTGGTRGIGREIVRALAPTTRVIVGGRDAAAVAAVVAEHPGASGFVADLGDPDAVARAVAGLGERLDAVVHSAGVVSHGRADELSWDEWRRVLDLNVIAVAELTRLLLPRLRAARGQVVVLNSGAGFTAGPGSAIYAASKFAVRAWTDALRAEERGVLRVTSVHPGRVDTDMQRELQAAEGRADYDTSQVMTAAAVAGAVAFALDAPADACVETVSVRPAG
ncbi:SDR family oxidoreductase [Propioniciclava coleopterorum]|uniref:SDR family oxidoreductase n=1 Tax=Propioniciclava coleopterorum TaxID=2714937 RepID=A0A6G7Y903_9ACTN|nr:SDR family oxidoreductase [Propioniciclava coleopterorum]QIK73374.1 SDR family oxidoreductase [Propioniciclava coleopterorum]